ncbi:MAG: hypothetical protein DLM61_19980 [Pseudonocardiales bacterium]|nr:MAG: hypothetical protein DLM61_19980 [Pseudonocardiales bacterium]
MALSKSASLRGRHISILKLLTHLFPQLALQLPLRLLRQLLRQLLLRLLLRLVRLLRRVWVTWTMGHLGGL